MAQCSEDELYQRADNLVRHACQHFQSLFLQKWKLLTQTKWKGKNSVQLLVDMLDLQVSRILLPHQKDQLAMGVVQEWDITLLSRLLIYFNDEQNVEANEAIQSITGIRNKLAHNARKKLSFTEYSVTECLVKGNLIILGMKEKVIQNIINQAQATSMNSALELLKKRQAEGDDVFNKKNYEKAIQVYSDAMLLPNLPPGHLSVLYEKRGYCHVSILQKNINIRLKKAQWDLAFSDGEKAIELNIDSWKGHHILALVYQSRSKLDEALVHYRRAIAMSPGQSEVKSDMDACTILAGTFEREDHLDPHHMSMSLSERAKEFSDKTNCSISEADFLEMMKSGSKLFPGGDHVITGRQYWEGWGVPQNYSEAAKHFAKAKKVGNAEGIYMLALLYKDGLGVKQDILFAIELFLEAANKSVEVNENLLSLKSVGVLESQNSLGFLHEEGVGVPKDFGKAAYWYKKAADNGCGAAAHNLALLYIKGKGVPLNEKMAEMYWKAGVRDNKMSSAHALFTYYLQRMEPKLARSYFNMAIKMGNDRLKTSKVQAFEMIDKVEKERAELEDDIKAFEEDNSLSIKGLTFSERMKREASSRSPEMAKLVEDMNKVRIGQDSNPQIWAGKAKVDTDINELVWKAEEGSKTAQSILKCMENNARFMQMMNQGPPNNQDEIVELISTLYSCLSTEGHQFKLTKEMHYAALQLLNKLFQSSGKEKSKLDMQLRLCLFYLQCGFGGVDQLQTEILVEAVRRYPDEIPLYKDLSNAYAHLNQSRKGLKVCIKGLLKAPNDPDLLHCKAAHLRLLDEEGTNEEKVREAFKMFIENAPVDHRMLPEAYYCIGLSYRLEMKTKKKEMDEMMCHYYGLGEEAEKVQLSCYLPYESDAKLVLKSLVVTIKNEKNSTVMSEIDAKTSRSNPCATSSGSEKKIYLKDLRRVEIIKEHRQWANHYRKSSAQNNAKSARSVVPKLVHKIPKSIDKLNAIVLQEMNPTKDQIYEGRILSLTVIEGPFFGLASIPLIAEDDNGEATRLVIYDVEQNEQAKKTFGVGAKFSIINPYMRMAQDGANAIRVDDPKCLIHNEGVKDMCRYCGKEGAKSNCSKCKVAKYCGRECQEMDWKVLKHKLICETVSM